MTTIACNTEMMVSDSQVTCGNCCSSTKKIHQLKDGTLIGYAGEQELGEIFVEWYSQGADRSTLPSAWDAEGNFEGMVLAPNGKIFSYGSRLFRIAVREKFYAIGSGDQFAIGAMEAGADPVEAVRIAVRRDAYTGGKVVIKRR